VQRPYANMAPLRLVPEPEAPRSTGGGIADRYLPDFFTLSQHLREKLVRPRMSPDWTIPGLGHHLRRV